MRLRCHLPARQSSQVVGPAKHSRTELHARRSRAAEPSKSVRTAILHPVNEAVAYWLLFLDLAVGAAVIWTAIWIVLWLIRRVRRSRQPAAAGQAADQMTNAVKRRCDRCGCG